MKKLAVVLVALAAVGPLPAQEPKLLFTLEGHSDLVLAVAFSLDAKTVASASQDRTIKLWDMGAGKNTATLKGHSPDFWGVFSVAFSPDGKSLASGGHDRTVR